MDDDSGRYTQGKKRDTSSAITDLGSSPEVSSVTPKKRRVMTLSDFINADTPGMSNCFDLSLVIIYQIHLKRKAPVIQWDLTKDVPTMSWGTVRVFFYSVV
jgi:hypothetical protein